MEPINYRETEVVLNDLQLSYLEWGTECNQPLVCLHGHTGNAHIWDEFAAAYSSKYHIYALDQRGHGNSQWANDYARERFVEDLSAFVNHLNLSTFTLVGLSMGGWNSLLYTRDHPERVTRIVLVDISPELTDDFLIAWENRPVTPMDFQGIDDAVEWMQQQSPWVDKSRLQKDANDNMYLRDDGRWSWKADPSLFKPSLPDMTDPEYIQRYWDAIRNIKCPILEVRGSESGFVSESILRRMRNSVDNFTWKDVEGAGHIVTTDNPQGFIDATKPFLLSTEH